MRRIDGGPCCTSWRRQLQEDEITFEEARRTIVELEGALEKVTAPANRVGTLLSAPENGIAYITVGGAEYYANVDSRLDERAFEGGDAGAGE